MFHPVTNEEIILTKEQRSCVDYVGDKRKDLVIRSAAGGGKSLVLLERAMRYLKDAKVNGNRRAIAIFTYNQVLAACLKEWMRLTSSDEAYIMVGTLHEYLGFVYDRIPKSKWDKLGNPAYLRVKENLLTETLNEYAERIGNDKYKRWGTRFWSEEFSWMRTMNIFYREDSDRYFPLKREGRGHTHHMDQIDRRAAFEMFCLLREKLKAKKCYDDDPKSDERILYLTHNDTLIPDALKFDHVLIDEAQDQSLAKMIALRNLARQDLTICMDVNQRIYEGRWKFKDADLNVQSKILSYPFRCTGQIDALAESLKEKNQAVIPDEERVKHVAPTAVGEKPEVVCCKNEEEERRYVIALVKKWMQDDPLHTIGIMCYKNKAVEKVAGWLSQEHIEFQFIRLGKDEKYNKVFDFSIRKPGVKLCTMHTAKGLEFMRVILPQFYQGMVPQSWACSDEEEMMRQRSIAYVGMTRAMHQLSIVYNGRKSQFINEMDPALYTARTFEEAVKTELKQPTPMYRKRVLPVEDSPVKPREQEAKQKAESRRKRWSF